MATDPTNPGSWVRFRAEVRLKEDIPNGPKAGSIGRVQGKPDSRSKVPVNFGKGTGGAILVSVTQIEEVKKPPAE